MKSLIWKKRLFYFLLSSLDDFYFFFFPNCSSRTSSTVLNRNGKRRCRLVHDLRGEALSFPPLSMMFAVGFSNMAFTRARQFLSFPS
jgi:hypothetical protein